MKTVKINMSFLYEQRVRRKMNIIIDYIDQYFIKIKHLDFPEIIFIKDRLINGSYDDKTNYIGISPMSNDNNTLDVFIHEIGHFVHHKIFNYTKFHFNKDEATRPNACYNNRENFAECFAETIAGIKNKRTKHMINILKSISSR
jgi:hypothetical protein